MICRVKQTIYVLEKGIWKITYTDFFTENNDEFIGYLLDVRKGKILRSNKELIVIVCYEKKKGKNYKEVFEIH